MTYMISWTDFLTDVTVRRFDNSKTANLFAETLPNNTTAYVVCNEGDFSKTNFSASTLARLYNIFLPTSPVSKFENHETARYRTWLVMDARYKNLQLTELPTMNETIETNVDAIAKMEKDVDAIAKMEKDAEKTLKSAAKEAAKAAKEAAAAEAKAAKESAKAAAAAEAKAGKEAAKAAKEAAAAEAAEAKAAKKAAKTVAKAETKTDDTFTKKVANGLSAGTVDEFKSVREGTFRASLIRAMDGTQTLKEIGEAHGKNAALVVWHARCLTRDCGIGYGFENGKIVALFPEGKSLADAIKSPVVKEKVMKVLKADPSEETDGYEGSIDEMEAA